MGYSKNKFSPLTDDINLIIDGCGNTYEKKYYVNGTYIDLCGMTVEEYMKNPCCCNGGSGSGDNDEPSKILNEILVKSFNDENNVIYYQAYAQFAVTSNIQVTVVSTSGVATVLDLYVGDKKSLPEIGETLDFSEISLNVREDMNYEYMPVLESSKTAYDIYTNAVQLSNTNVLIEDFDKQTMEEGTTVDIVFTIPGTDYNYYDIEDMDEFHNFCVKNQYSLVLCIPKSLYDNKQYIISNYAGSDVTYKFNIEKELIIDNIGYVYLVEKGTDDIMPFVPLYNEELVYEYKLTLNK